ncbi:MAG: DUF6786 family protein [Thermoguttaceae bacterium]|jgi:hypothetical protein
MSYGEVRDFLVKHTQLIELADPGGARMAVAPMYQGRVMTSSCNGPDGMSFGFVNRDFISAGIPNQHFNNYGGEERMWISPEGGQFSLWFKPGIKQQTLADWFTPPELNDGPWPVVAREGNTSVRMAAKMKLQNTSGTRFDVEVNRGVRLLSAADCQKLFGPAAVKTISQHGIKMVAYETINQITNLGPPMSKEKGLISIWMLGMLNAGPETVVLVPFKPGDPSQLGPAVQSDYFGKVPPERLKILPEAVLFRADGQFRSKIGTSQRRARDTVGSIDFLADVLTLVKFSMPRNPAENLYMSNLWGGPLAQPYVGDVMNSYNDGPPEPGKKGMGAFYELESLSPAKELKTGESISHTNVTLHIQADRDILAQSAKEILGVDLEKVRHEMQI